MTVSLAGEPTGPGLLMSKLIEKKSRPVSD
jgi:hypothetical protein